MSATEFMQWQVLCSIEPFGDLRADVHAAMLATTISNMSGKSLKTDLQIKDFVIDFIKPPVRQSVEEMHANFLRIFEFAQNKAKQSEPS